MEKFTFDGRQIFHQFGLEVADDIRCHKANLIIGKNGSGKTRLLKAIEKIYRQKEPEKFEVVTLYFPEINSFFTPSSGEESEEGYTAELGASIFSGESMSFQDFLKLAQRDNISFLTDFFMFMSANSLTMRRQYRADFSRLNGYLRRFLGWELCESKEGEKIIAFKQQEGRELRRVTLLDMLYELSPGELMLFYVCLFLFYLGRIHRKKFVLILDEPEQHLHPKVLTDLIKVLKEEPSVAQLWIATHSLFLLPLFAFEQLVYVKSNKILKLNRSTYQDIYDDLVGLENIDMYELLKSVENWAYYQFITETFFLPASKDTVNRSDEQFQKLLMNLRQIKRDRPLNVLDYGAGKFRIWECLRLELPNEEERAKLLCYEAYEPYPSPDIEIPASVTLHEEEQKLPLGRYDVVVLMNVLHEIDPFKWCHTFTTIHNLLTEQGILIFLEVLTLTNGEQPYGEAGYLLLQDAETKYLFPNAQLTPLEGANKSHCWVIPRSDLKNIGDEKVRETIGLLEKNCELQLEKMDRERIDFANQNKKEDKIRIKPAARKYAFLAQQYINAHIACKRMQQELTSNQYLSESDQEKLSRRALKPVLP